MHFKTSKAGRIALSVLAAGALSAGVVGATSASATEIQTGYGKVVNDGLAVGTNIDATTGVPGGKATFVWDLDNGVTSVHVTGKFSVIGRSGVPVRLDLNYYKKLNGKGKVAANAYTLGRTPASDALVIDDLDWAPTGGIGYQSAKLCVSNDADGDGVYTLEKCITTTL